MDTNILNCFHDKVKEELYLNVLILISVVLITVLRQPKKDTFL